MVADEGLSIATIPLILVSTAVAALILWSLLKALLKTVLIVCVVLLSTWGVHQLFPAEFAVIRSEILARISAQMPASPLEGATTSPREDSPEPTSDSDEDKGS